VIDLETELGLSEAEAARRGRLIAEGLNLKRDRDYPDRWQTNWGTKTDLGLFRILARLIQDGE
jgi:hypothetical protein